LNGTIDDGIDNEEMMMQEPGHSTIGRPRGTLSGRYTGEKIN